MEHVLAAYSVSLGGARRGVPREIRDTATGVSAENLPVHLSGPAEATAGAIAPEEEVDAIAGAAVGEEAAGSMDSSAAVLDTGLEDISFLRLWNEAIRKYHVLQELEETYERAEQEGNDGARAQALKEEAFALAEAVHALQRLGNH